MLGYQLMQSLLFQNLLIFSVIFLSKYLVFLLLIVLLRIRLSVVLLALLKKRCNFFGDSLYFGFFRISTFQKVIEIDV
jgi:hypothetical protein